MIAGFSDGWDLVVRVGKRQSEGKEVADKEQLDFREGCARNEVVFWWKEMQEGRRRNDDGEHRYPTSVVLGLPHTPYFSTQWPRAFEKVCIRVDDGYDMGEWNVFARGSWTRRIDGLRVVRSRGESNRKATNDFAECSRNRFGRLTLVGGFLVPKTPGSCLFRHSNRMAIKGNRRGIYRGPNRGIDGEFVGCASPSSATAWNVHRHVVKV